MFDPAAKKKELEATNGNKLSEYATVGDVLDLLIEASGQSTSPAAAKAPTGPRTIGGFK